MENQRSFFQRFWIYLKERFPLHLHGVLIAVFTYSAISYSRICSGFDQFIPLPHYLAAVFFTFTLFLLLRISDEYKDRKEDALYRKYLPVPRGLISFKELFAVAVLIILLQILVLVFFLPTLFLPFGLICLYMLLMFFEFGMPEWLKKHQVLYVFSHMLIIPLVDIFATGFDWKLAGNDPPYQLLWFFAVSFSNGLVLEIGRKIKSPEKEEPGVVSYSGMFGPKRATYYWLFLLFLTFLLALGSGFEAGFGRYFFIPLGLLFVLVAFPAYAFIKVQNQKNAKRIENLSGIWAICMYLFLGAFPMISNYFGI